MPSTSSTSPIASIGALTVFDSRLRSRNQVVTAAIRPIGALM